MPPRGKNTLTPVELARVESALRADSALATELEMIEGFFDSATRARFWKALAVGLEHQQRPAAAVLEALEHAARGEPG